MKEDPPRGFGAPIIYNKQQRGYAYADSGFSISEIQLEEEEWEALAYASNLLTRYRQLPLIDAFASAIEKINARFAVPYDYRDPGFRAAVQLDVPLGGDGMAWLAPCYRAIRDNRVVELQYELLHSTACNSYRVHPYQLRELNYRWFLLGWVEERSSFRRLALDGIKQMAVTSERKKNHQHAVDGALLQQAQDVETECDRLWEVELDLLWPTGKLLLRQPLHPSQKVLRQTAGYTRISLTVQLVPEIQQRILALGDCCKVKKPAVLRQAITKQLEATLQHYK